VITTGEQPISRGPGQPFGDGSSIRPGAPVPAPSRCPACSSPDPGEGRFCEECGASLFPPASEIGSRTPAPSTEPAPTDAVVNACEVVAIADRGYFDRVQADSVNFPAVPTERHFQLTASRATIGRRSATRGIAPDIDLSSSPTDTGISHQHAILLHQMDGTWAIVDPGSTNGLFINDSDDPLPVNRVVPLADGDQIHLGAWTTLSIRSNRGRAPG
jgi:FHA domain